MKRIIKSFTFRVIIVIVLIISLVNIYLYHSSDGIQIYNKYDSKLYQKKLVEIMKEFKYSKYYEKNAPVTVYYPNSDIKIKNIILYFPGFGRSFTMFNHSKTFMNDEIAFCGVELYGYGNTYREGHGKYNQWNDKKYENGISTAIKYIKNKYDNPNIILMGNSTSCIILVEYLKKNKPYGIKGLILTSPIFYANRRDVLVERIAVNILGNLSPNFILKKDDKNLENNTESWLNKLIFNYNDNNMQKTYYDPIYNPLSNKPSFALTLKKQFQVTYVDKSITDLVKNVLCFMKTKDDEHVNVIKVKDILSKNKAIKIDLNEKYNHEVLLTDDNTALKHVLDKIIKMIKTL